MANVSIDQLADAITNAVREYTEDVSAAIEKEVENTANEVLKEVKATAPKRTGEYRKGFGKTKRSGGGETEIYIWNKKKYRLVHLLEFGHAKRGGGRVAGRPHLRPAYDKYAAGLPARIEKIIRNGG